MNRKGRLTLQRAHESRCPYKMPRDKIPPEKVSKKSIYIARRHETSNALNASVRCEQKRLQRLSQTVPANNRIPQAVWQGIPDRRTSHTESPSAIKAELMAQYDQELSGGG